MQASEVGHNHPLRAAGPVLALLLLAASVSIGVVAFGPSVFIPVFLLVFFSFVVTRPEFGVAILLSTFLMAYPAWLQGSGYLTLNNVLGGILLVRLAYQVYRDQDWWFLRCRELQLLLFIVVTYFVSERLNGPDPAKVELLGAGFYFAEGLRLFANRVAFTLFFINYIRTPANVRMIYVLALSFMVVTALTGVQGILLGGGLYGFRATTGVEELVAGQAGLIRAAGNPNRLAMFSILAIAGLWYLMQSMRIPLARLVIVPTLVVLSLAVFMTASRSGLLGLVVCVGAIIIDGGVNARKVFSFGVAAALLLLAVGQFVPERTLERITNIPGTEEARLGEGAASLQRRQYAVEVAFDMFKESPFVGVGMGNWAVARFLSDPGRFTGSPHNSYLLALTEGGVFCLIGFLVVLWGTWRNLRAAEAYVTARGSPLADLAWIVKASKVSFVVLVFFSMFADLWNLVILFLLIAIGVVLQRIVEEAKRVEESTYVP